MRKPIDETLSALEAKEAFLEFSNSRGWKTFAGILGEHLSKRVNRLCQVDCSNEETNRLRGEIALLDTLLRVPQLTANEVERFRKDLVLQRAIQAKRDTYGWDDEEVTNGQVS